MEGSVYMGKALRRKKTRPRKKRLGIFLMSLVFVFVLLFTAFIIIDSKIFPLVLEVLENELVSTVNMSINESAAKTISQLELTSSDFYEKSESEDGKINSIAVNTVLINTICNQIAVDISENLNNIGPQKVSLPIGSIAGIKTLANIGPSYTVTALPMGNAVVDYNSSFESVGINQVNFQIWIKVDTKIKVVNPLQTAEINITRKLPLVNTIINNEIPAVYFNNPK
jgi:sporulation protein YunB